MADPLNYAQIKSNLLAAGRMVDAGDIAGADALVRSMAGRCMTLADIDANLTATQKRKLRAHGKRASK